MGNKNGTPVLREQDIAALSKSSGMAAAQVKEHFNAFLTAHPNLNPCPPNLLVT